MGESLTFLGLSSRSSGYERDIGRFETAFAIEIKSFGNLHIGSESSCGKI